MIINIKNSLWAVPFCIAITGYIAMNYFFTSPVITTPCIVGLSVENALLLLSSSNTHLNIIKQEEDETLNQGTIIQQTPLPGQKIKAQQTIYIVTSKKPAEQKVPSFILKNTDEILKEAKKQSLRIDFYDVPHNYPKNLCFAQYPKEGTIKKNDSIIIYRSQATEKPVLFPRLCGKNLATVLDFLQKYNNTPSIIPDIPLEPNQIMVIEQRPLAGSFLHLNSLSSLPIQLRVAPI